MINAFILKKYAALLIISTLSAVLFFTGTLYYGVFGGVGFWFGALVMGIPLASLILKNPFTSMLEGKGLLAMNMDSTGIVRPFIVRLKSPYIEGKLGSKKINDVFDRSTIGQLTKPIDKGSYATPEKEGGLHIKLTEKEYSKARFALYHYPLIIWNEQLNSLLTKDFFSDKEKDAFAEHGVLYLNRKVEELTSAIRDFGRYAVEMTKPRSEWYKNKWVWIVLIVGLLLILGLFAFPVIKSIAGAWTSTSGSVSGITGGTGTIIPR